ncbi:MAG: class I SAM-dependent methyltransferase, partial [Thermodesulfobacteriota bacterium]|nr:class I SAM-dependent methyltransferase [Thermodesulfobacteriota bacterium]
MKRLPYPVTSIKYRDIEFETIPPHGGTETFDTFEASEINYARLAHLESLRLPIKGKTVLDIGCGVGHLAQFFITRGCKVVCLDAREDNIKGLYQKYPNLEAHVANIESETMLHFGKFDIVFTYGLLYHLENPLVALRNMSSVCKEMLLLETLVCDCA